jgi:hypothetical protein
MVARNNLLEAPPFAVEQALTKLGRNLRLARLRRQQTIAETAKRIGTGSRAIRDAETGKPSTAIAVYAALLWTYDLLSPIDELANPLKDREGLARVAAAEGYRAHKPDALDNDF